MMVHIRHSDSLTIIPSLCIPTQPSAVVEFSRIRLRMRAATFSALAVAALAAPAATAPSAAWSCCAYGGAGAATMSGTATADVSGSGRAELVAAFVAADPSPGGQLTSVLLGGAGDADSSSAGWILEQVNATDQRFTVWFHTNATGELECHRADGAWLAGSGLGLCPGAAGSTFPTFVGGLMLGSVPGALFGQEPPAQSTAAFTTAAGGCAPLWISSPVTPLGAGLGAFTIAVTQGSASLPPQGMRTPPAACVF